MEARRGKTNIERMVAKWREDEENKKWLEEKTRACSGCGVRVEKR
jgi:E3 ubiquitin-protein ligase RNF14